MPKRLLLVVLTVVMGMMLSTPQAYAQSKGATTSGNGMRISPVRTELTIDPGTSKSVDIYIQNITDSPANLRGVINDFVASDDETGSPRVILDENVAAPSHGLKSYVAKIGDVSLQPQERKIVKVTISIPKGTAGGGYYGAVRFMPASVDSSKNVSLAASVASLLLVKVPGEIKEQASVDSFNISKGDGKASNTFTSGKGLRANVRIRNGGNIQVAPFGKVTLKKSGKVLMSQEVNNTDPRGNVLPDSVRKFTVDFGDKTSSIGKYTVEGDFGYGSGGKLISAKTSFYVVPLAYVLIGAGLLLVIIAAILIGVKTLRSHDRKLIRKVRSHQ